MIAAETAGIERNQRARRSVRRAVPCVQLTARPKRALAYFEPSLAHTANASQRANDGATAAANRCASR